MNVLMYCLAAVFAVLAILNFTFEFNSPRGHVLNAINGIVSVFFGIAVVAFVPNKALSGSILIYFLVRYFRQLHFAVDELCEKEKAQERAEYYEKRYYEEKEKAKKEIEFQKQVADEYREANRELYRKLYPQKERSKK